MSASGPVLGPRGGELVATAIGELERAGVTARPEVALADAGYWNEQHMDEMIANKHIQVLILGLSRPSRAAAGLDQRALLMDANRAGIRRTKTRSIESAGAFGVLGPRES